MSDNQNQQCNCNWSIGMGPNINCPIHGRPDLQIKMNREEQNVSGDLRENLKEISPATILTSVEAGITADQIIETVLAQGYVKVDDTTRIFF